MERLRQRKLGHHKTMSHIRDFYLERVKIEEEYSQKLYDLGSKYFTLIESADEFEDFPPTFGALVGDTQQLGSTRKQLKEQIASEILNPVDGFLKENPHPERSLTDGMNFTSASLDLRDYLSETQEIIKESLSKFNIIFSILSEFEQDFTKRFTGEIDQFDTNDFINEIISREEMYFPKQQEAQQSAPKPKKKKGLKVTFAEKPIIIGYSDTESKSAPVFVAETVEEEEAFAEIAAIMGKKPSTLPREHEQTKKLFEDVDDDPRFRAAAPPKKPAASVDPLDSFLMSTKKVEYEEEEEEEEEEKPEAPPQIIQVAPPPEPEPEPVKPVAATSNPENKPKASSNQTGHNETQQQQQQPQQTANKPPIPAKPPIPPKPTEFTSLGVVITENISCQFTKGQLMRCDLSGQVSFVGALRKDTTDFYFDLTEKSNIENVIPNKSFVHITPQQKLGYQCSVQSLGHFLSPGNPVAGLKYRVLSNTIANKVPLMVSIAWKCEPTLTSIIVNYKGSTTFPLTLKDLCIEVVISGGATAVQSKPQGQFTQSSQSIKWDLGTVKVGPQTDVSGKLLARITVQRQSTPSPVSASFTCEGQLLSDCTVEVKGPDTIKWQPIVKRLVALTYLGS